MVLEPGVYDIVVVIGKFLRVLTGLLFTLSVALACFVCLWVVYIYLKFVGHVCLLYVVGSLFRCAFAVSLSGW